MAALFILDVIDQLEQEERIPRRRIRDRENAFELPDEHFIKYFRVSKDITAYVAHRLRSHLPSQGFPSELRVLVALRFYAAGGYQQTVANDYCLAVSQMTVSRSIRIVSRAITEELMLEEISLPGLTEQQEIKRSFYIKSGVPGYIGAIDCTHCLIVQPNENSSRVRRHSYLNRKRNFSINVQLIVDDKILIRGINAKYPGSVHDAFIWSRSLSREALKTQHENGNDNAWLIGDSGYPLEPWLMTPFADPTSRAEERFNRKHASARSCVERCNGVLKGRFRCLLKHRVMHYHPTEASFIINACAVLHNLCVKRGLELDEDEIIIEVDKNKPALDETQNTSEQNRLRERAQLVRRRIADAL